MMRAWTLLRTRPLGTGDERADLPTLTSRAMLLSAAARYLSRPHSSGRSSHRRLRFTFLDAGDLGDSSAVSQSPHCLRASTADSFSAAFLTSGGTHCGNRIVTSSCAPDFVCSSRMASRRAGPISSARRTSAGHKRRWQDYREIPKGQGGHALILKGWPQLPHLVEPLQRRR